MVVRQIADQLYETSTTDSTVFVAAPGVVAWAVLLSVAIPATRSCPKESKSSTFAGSSGDPCSIRAADNFKSALQ
jgi:hypothetical protein